MKCMCCDSNQIVKKFKKKSFQIFECKSCGFQFVYPLPSVEVIKAYYNQTRLTNYNREALKQRIDDFYESTNNPKKDWYNKVLAIANKYTNKKSMNILEIGSAFGMFVDYSNKNGHNAIGVEVTEEYAMVSKGLINGEVLHLGLNEYRSHFRDEKFDFIYLEHVFEHVLNPSELFKSLTELLADNGVIILAVPNHKSLLSRIYQKHYKWLIPPDHLYYYNKDSIKTFVERLGFFCVDAWADDYYHRSIYQFYSLDFITHRVKRVINKIFKLNLSRRHSYKYPRKISDILTLTPYLIIYPIIKFLNTKYEMGNELTMVIRKNPT